MRRTALVTLLALLALTQAAMAQSCQVGKISYCFKYGQSICEQGNTSADKVEACKKWTAACVDCHNAIPTCFGGKRPPGASPVCSKCREEWQACMQRIDRRFWPNRMSG